MKYYLFIDESGDHGLVNLDPGFPVFLLCGVLLSQEDYSRFQLCFGGLKNHFFGSKKICFHSRDIRKWQNGFEILMNPTVREDFYGKVNAMMSQQHYTVFASAIDKQKYITKYGKLSDDVYEMALSFIIERVVFYLDDMPDADKQLEIIIEKRGAKEDQKLSSHFQKLMARGTGFVNSQRLNDLKIKIYFRTKNDDIEGLQLADLVAYPTARFVMDREKANPAFDLLKPKFYKKNGKIYGLKTFP